jgi:hypothetical protein
MTNQECVRLLDQLASSGFYGSVEIKFEAGRVVLLRKTETVKINNCRDTRGDHVGRN